MNDKELRLLARDAAVDALLVHRNLTTALATLNAQLDHLDGYPTTASGADTGPPGHTTDTPVERIVAQRIGTWKPGPSYEYDELVDWILTYRKGARNALIAVERLTGRRLTPRERSAAQCVDCADIADPRRDDGRCIRHGQLEDERRTARSNSQRRWRHGSTITPA